MTAAAFPYLCNANVLSVYFKCNHSPSCRKTLSQPVSADESFIKVLDKAGKQSIFALSLRAQQRHCWLFSAHDWWTPRHACTRVWCNLTPSQLPLAIFHWPVCIFSLSSSFNLGDEIHSLSRVAPPTHLLSSTFARAPSFFLWKARRTGDVKAASRRLEAKSNMPVNNSTDDGKGRGVQEI